MSISRRYPLTTRCADEIIAYVGGEAVTVGAFLATAELAAAQLPEAAFAINLSTDRYEFLLGFCAAVIAGQCTLMPPNRQRGSVLSVAEKYADCYVLGGEPVEGLAYRQIAAVRDAGPVAEPPAVEDEQLCAIVFTSGSTGDAQPNRKYWKTLRMGSASNAELICDIPEATLNLVATVPAQHMWGFETTILLPLFASVAVNARTPFFPQDIVDAVGSLPRPRGLVSSPVHLNAFLAAETDGLEIDRIYSATAPMPVETARLLEERFGAKFIEIFGCSESGIIAARRTSAEEDWHLATAFRLRNEGRQTQILADHLEAAVSLNDRVEILERQRFRWHGRDDDMVNIAGKRGSLADINRRVSTLPGVVDAVVFLPDADAARLAALVVAPSLQPSDILAGLRESIDPAFLPRPIFMVPGLPRQETGKLPRKKLLELFNALRAQSRTGKKDDEASPSAG
jgi:acyl-coenzyme A synthetase/AMP-(fatty) acid ligase